LARTDPSAERWQCAPGWFAVRQSVEIITQFPSIAFSLQCLPNAQVLSSDSIRQAAEQVGQRIVEALYNHNGVWRLHVFHARDSSAVRPGRSKLLRSAILDWLGRKQRRLLRTRNAADAAIWNEQECLIQAGLMDPSKTAFSACDEPTRQRWRSCISRFPGGVALTSEDSRPPSRAYLKLLEAEQHLGRSIAAGETCVDLGGSPGGWSWVALERGAEVWAVDRSPLRNDLMQIPRMHFQRADAFRFEPQTPVDWLLCDVIAFPQRTLELLHNWLARGWCRHFCVTVKFRGDADYPVLEELKQMLAQSGAEFIVRRLLANKNEVTAFGSFEPASSGR
jgi:23S rRNA (cytidine2498-2'-O)-methyltransferase